MIAEKNTDVQVKSNLDGFQAIDMGIAEDATAHIISLLTDLYGNQIGAVVREYATNAKDAQIEAGVVAPIHVTLPTYLSPLYTIRDSGVGLGRDEIGRIYSQYGASTKRGTNSQNGMLGLGCKAALTYTNQFTIVSVKGGVRTTVIVSRKDDDVPTMTVVDEVPTTDPQGTEVQVPVKREDMHTFEREAGTFFSYWPEGDVLVNGQPPRRVEGLKIGADMLIVNTGGYQSEHKIVMGDVAYPAPADFSVGLPHGNSLVAWVPIGSVRFAPSREALMTTSGTKATLEAVKQAFKAQAAAAIQTEIDACSTHREALKMVLKWSKIVPGVDRSTLTFKGQAIPQHYDPGHEMVQVPGDSSSKLSQHNRAKMVNAEVFDSTVFVYNYDRTSFTAGQKKKLLMWVSEGFQNGTRTERPRHFVLTTAKPTTPYIDQSNVVEWATINALKLPRAQYTSSGRIPGSYDFFEGLTFREGTPDDEIDTSYPVYYIEGKYHEASSYASVLATKSPDFTLVILQSNRVTKFLRNFPQATKARDAVAGVFTAWASKLTQEQRMALVVQEDYSTRGLQHIDPALVDDPAIKEAVRLKGVDLSQVQRERQAFERVTSVQVDNLPTWVNPLNKYPLAGLSGYNAPRHMDHVYAYMNVIYAMSQAPKA